MDVVKSVVDQLQNGNILLYCLTSYGAEEPKALVNVPKIKIFDLNPLSRIATRLDNLASGGVLLKAPRDP